MLIYGMVEKLDLEPYPWIASGPGELHTYFDGVERLTYELRSSENITVINYEGVIYSLASASHTTSCDVGSESDWIFVVAPRHSLLIKTLVCEGKETKVMIRPVKEGIFIKTRTMEVLGEF